jgi:hypothetical protein
MSATAKEITICAPQILEIRFLQSLQHSDFDFGCVAVLGGGADNLDGDTAGVEDSPSRIEHDFDRRWVRGADGPYRSPRQLSQTSLGPTVVLHGLGWNSLSVEPNLGRTQDRLTPPVDNIVLLDDVMPFLVITHS